MMPANTSLSNHIMRFFTLALASCSISFASSQNQLSINGNALTYTDKMTLSLDIPFTVYFNRTTPNTTTLQFAVTAQAQDQWVGFGFSATGRMTPARALIASKPAGGDAVVLEYDMSRKASSGVQPVTDSVVNNTVVEYKSDGTVAFAFTLPVSAEASIKTDSGAKSGFIYAYGPQSPAVDRLLKHRKYGVLSFALDGSGAASGGSSKLALYVHVFAMAFAWMILAPIGALIGNVQLRKRWFPSIEGNPKHSGPHRWTMVVVSLLCIIGFIVGIAFLGSHTNIAHMAVGIVVFILTLFQSSLGYWRTTIQPTGKPTTAFEKVSKGNKNTISTVHGWLGRVTWILAVVNVYLGIQIYSVWDNPTVTVVVWAIASVIGAILFVTGTAYSFMK
jgi:hypothetical protein